MKPSMQLKVVFDGDMVNIDTPNDFPFIYDSMKKEIEDMYIEHGLYFGLLKGKCDCCKHDRDSFGLQANTHYKEAQKMCLAISDAISTYVKETKMYEKKEGE